MQTIAWILGGLAEILSPVVAVLVGFLVARRKPSKLGILLAALAGAASAYVFYVLLILPAELLVKHSHPHPSIFYIGVGCAAVNLVFALVGGILGKWWAERKAREFPKL